MTMKTNEDATTMTTATGTDPRKPTIPRPTTMRLARVEYQRCVDMLRTLRPDDWTKPTACPDWDVRAVAAHMLGMVEMAASIREGNRQRAAAGRRGGVLVDALTALQVEERADMTPQEIVDRFEARAPKAARARRFIPAVIRRRPLPDTQLVGGREERWTVGFAIDIIFTRDPWMHRIDIVRATGAPHILTPEHDGILVANVVDEWAQRHGQPFTLHLTGPAGGTWTVGTVGPRIETDAIDFCRVLSGRDSGEGLLQTEVPF